MNLLHSMVMLSTLVALTTAATISKFHFVEEWNLWKSQHQKYYNTEEDELMRHTIWLSNKKYIDTHNANADKFGFTLAMNRLGDITDQEYRDLHCCYKEGNFTGRVDHMVFQPPQINLPDSVDWRTKNAVTPVKNQGSCSACYAFSATGALEGAHALAHDSLISISEQNIVDCSVPYGNHGCNGGNTYDVFQYVIDNGGLDTESSYPYKGRQSQCRFDKNSIGATEAGIVTITSGSESDLTAATATAGPVAVAVDGSSNAFRFYASGIFDEPNCSSTRPTHSMLIIGYGTDGGKDYWTVKNSWGTSWGMRGYIKMTRNQSNQCGIATAASFPTL